MKFANVSRALPSSRFAWRLALFSFLCLMLFALSSPRLNIAPAVSAAASSSQELPQRKSPRSKDGTIRTKTDARPSSRKQRAKAVPFKSTGDVQASAVCAQNQPISFGSQVGGSLQNGDCVSPVPKDGDPPDGALADEYTFSGTAGQQVAISLNSTAFDTYLYLLRPDGTVLVENDDIDGDGVPANLNSRIPIDGFFILPSTGTYSILASSFAPEARGAYTLTLTAGGNCTPSAIVYGETKAGTLNSGDCINPIDIDNTFSDIYTFSGTAGQQVSITMTAAATGSSVNPYLYLLQPDGEVIAQEDEGGPGTAARIPFLGEFGRLPVTGTYTIIANTLSSDQNGGYNLTLTQGPVCVSESIASGSTINGSLANGDCRLLEDGSFIDSYTFNGTAGRRVVITMTSTTAGLSPTLFLFAPNLGNPVALEKAPGGGNTVRIPPATGSFTLPATGAYTILANSFATGQSGNYTLSLVDPDCTFTLSATSQAAPSGGGQFNVGVTTLSGCNVSATSNAPWLTVTSTNNGAGPVTYTVQPNTAATSRTGTLSINGQTFTVTQAALVCTYSLPQTGQTVSSGGGTFNFAVNTLPDCQLPQPTSDSPWIVVNSAGTDGNGAGRVDFTVQPNTVASSRSGTITVGSLVYSVTQNSAVIPPPAIQFQSGAFTVDENDPSKAALITVQRTGDTTGTSTVEYATVDDSSAVPCDPTIKRPDGTLYPQGTAYARCDYATSVDTLTFAPGDTVKTFSIPLINDVHVEGNETFQISLTNPQGATLGQSTATVTIQFDDTALPMGNPINQTPFFVRMQYLDFLSREPEPDEPWSRVLNNCPNRFNPAADFTSPSAGCDRIIVSQSFFGSPEFRLKGFFVFLYYKASFGNPNSPNYYPEYDQFAPDIRRVSGQTSEEVFAKRLAFSNNWLTRPAFVAAFADIAPLTPANNAAFVDRLLANLNITLTVADPASGETRNSLISHLDNGRKTRAEVLRIIVESTEANNAQFNFAFVAIQYFGYLRRTPDASGYQAWLNVLNNPNIDPRARPRLMIDGFMNSTEYRIRFGPNTIQP